MKGGRVEFNMPKARVALDREPRRIDLHVAWACVAMAAFLLGYYAGGAHEDRPRPECRHALNDGVIFPPGVAQCTYLTPSPLPRKGKSL